MFRLSFLLYSPMGIVLVVLCGLLASLCLGESADLVGLTARDRDTERERERERERQRERERDFGFT